MILAKNLKDIMCLKQLKIYKLILMTVNSLNPVNAKYKIININNQNLIDY